jgi:hypothetical protein
MRQVDSIVTAVFRINEWSFASLLCVNYSFDVVVDLLEVIRTPGSAKKSIPWR